jgi:hypothetical protein
MSTRAASGIDGFDELLERAAAGAPERASIDGADDGGARRFPRK